MPLQKHLEKLSCGAKCMKYFLAILNIIFFLFGLAIAGVAGYSALNKESTIHRFLIQYNEKLVDGLYILLAVGLILAFIAFFGIWGALSESRCILFLYLTALLLVFALQLSGIIISIVEFKRIEGKIIDVLMKPVDEDDLTSVSIYTTLRIVESKFQCCGLTSPDNYNNQSLPQSCYPPPVTQVTPTGTAAPAEITEATPPAKAVPYSLGCIDTARPYLYAAGGIAIALLLLQLLVMIFTCCLMSAIKKGYEAV